MLACEALGRSESSSYLHALPSRCRRLPRGGCVYIDPVVLINTLWHGVPDEVGVELTQIG